MKEELYRGWAGTHDAFLEWQRVSAGRMCDYSHFTWQQIDYANGHPFTATVYSPPRAAASAFTLSPAIPSIEQFDADYDLILNTRRIAEHWHTRTKTAEVGILNDMVPNAWLEMNPAGASRLDLRSHDRVSVRSRRGAIANLELRITGIVAPGQVFMPFHFTETNSNIFIYIVTFGGFLGLVTFLPPFFYSQFSGYEGSGRFADRSCYSYRLADSRCRRLVRRSYRRHHNSVLVLLIAIAGLMELISAPFTHNHNAALHALLCCSPSRQRSYRPARPFPLAAHHRSRWRHDRRRRCAGKRYPPQPSRPVQTAHRILRGRKWVRAW